MKSVLEGKIEKHVYHIRKREVVLDLDLAALYGISTNDIKRAVKSNVNRFPPNIMFSLNKAELENLDRHISTSSHGGMRYAPMAFTAEGVHVLSGILTAEKNHTI